LEPPPSIDAVTIVIGSIARIYMLGDYVVIIKTLFSITMWKIKSISILVIFYDLPCTNLRHFLIVIMSTRRKHCKPYKKQTNKHILPSNYYLTIITSTIGYESQLNGENLEFDTISVVSKFRLSYHTASSHALTSQSTAHI